MTSELEHLATVTVDVKMAMNTKKLVQERSFLRTSFLSMSDEFYEAYQAENQDLIDELYGKLIDKYDRITSLDSKIKENLSDSEDEEFLKELESIPSSS